MTETKTICFPSEYTDVKKLGQGGTADVYLARRAEAARPLVLKKFFDPAAAELVNRERDISARIHFPGIVKVYRAATCPDSTPFLEMEYCPGPLLEDYIGKVSEPKLLAILSAAAVSLEVLHKARYVHNDLKPSNIFCPQNFGADDFPTDCLFYLKMFDFSLARPLSAEGSSAVTGTIGYMSPEMVLKQPITAASDIFSLGIIAYQLACGTLPFISESNDPLEINAQVTEGNRPALSGPGERFSKGTADLIRSMLAVDPSCRPQSAFALQEKLSQLGSPYRFREAIRPRHLLAGSDVLDEAALISRFGNNSFSAEQIRFLSRETGFYTPAVRLLLEENYTRGNFARLDGRWGWKNESRDVIEWSPRLTRFAMIPIKGTSIALKQAVLAMAVVNDLSVTEDILTCFRNKNETIDARWTNISSKQKPVLLASLARCLSRETRLSLAHRLLPVFAERPDCKAVCGRLHYWAGNYAEAVDFLCSAVDEAGKSMDQDIIGEMIRVALAAAEKSNDLTRQAEVLLRRAMMEKNRGEVDLSEKTYIAIIEMLEHTGSDVIIAKTCKALGDLYKSKADYESGIRVLNRGRQIYETLGDRIGLSHALNNLGNMYWIGGQLDQALEHYLQALEIQKELQSKKEIAISLSNIGTVYCVKGNYSQGIDYFNQSLVLQEELGDKGELARTWNNLGLASFLKGEATRALEAFEHSLRLNREIGATLEVMMNLFNLTEAMLQACRLQDTLAYLKEGAVLAEKSDDIPFRSRFAWMTGRLMMRMGYYDEAEAKLLVALDLADKLNNKSLQLPCHLALAGLHLELKEKDAAEKHHRQARDLAQAIGDVNALYHVSLMELEMRDTPEIREQTRKLLTEHDTPREDALLELRLMKLSLAQENIEQAEVHYTRAQEFFDAQQEDIEYVRFLLTAGQCALLKDHKQDACLRFAEALEEATARKLLPEQWQAATELSEVAFAQKDFERSFAYARQATETLKKIAARIHNSERLGRFYNDKKIVSLLGRIKSLQSVLSTAKRAVSP